MMRYDDGRRKFARNTPESLEFFFGQNGNRNSIMKAVRVVRGIQPGNTFTRQLRIASGGPPSSF